MALAIFAVTITSCKKDDKNDKVNSIVFQDDALRLRPSSEGKPNVLVDPFDAEIVWSSENTAIATVDNGIVTAVSGGTTIITAASKDGSVKSTL